MLHNDILARYCRHLQLPGFNHAHQQRLLEARILCVGAGALGCAALPLLVGAGLGECILIDSDTIDITNLHRQVFYTESDINAYKARTLAARLRALNSHTTLIPHVWRFDEMTLNTLPRNVNLILDASDNLSTHLLLLRTAQQWHVPYVGAGIAGYQGYALVLPREPWTVYQQYFNTHGLAAWLPTSCRVQGVANSLSNLVGSLQAQGCMELLTGSEKTRFSPKMVVCDIQKSRFCRYDL